jgi:hypothetical protein
MPRVSAVSGRRQSGEQAGGRGAELAEAHDADPALRCLGREGVGPLPRPLRALEPIEAPVMAQHGEQHVLDHGAPERGVDHAGDRHVRQLRIGEQAIHAGGERKDRAKVRVAEQLAPRRAPDQGDLDLRRVAGLGPDAEVELGHAARDFLAPEVGGVVGA